MRAAKLVRSLNAAGDDQRISYESRWVARCWAAAIVAAMRDRNAKLMSEYRDLAIGWAERWGVSLQGN